MIKNPTPEQLRTLTWLIYRIYWIANGQSYIGQTTQTFNHRYHGRFWWEHIDTRYLRNAVKKYGHLQYKIEILEYNIKTLEELNRLEEFYSDKYNSLHPNGYNLTKCGKASGSHLTKTITLKHKIKGIMSITNISKFCRDNNLNESMLSKVLCGKKFAYKQWSLPETNDAQIEYGRRKIYTAKEYDFIDPNGNPIHIVNMKMFCRENNIYQPSMWNVCVGRWKQYKGWRLASTPQEEIDNRYSVDPFTLQTIDNKTIKINNLKKFCKENHLSYWMMIQLKLDRRHEYKGFTKPKCQNDTILILK